MSSRLDADEIARLPKAGGVYDPTTKQAIFLGLDADTSVGGGAFQAYLLFFSVNDNPAPMPFWPLSLPFGLLGLVSYRQTSSAQKG